VKELPESVQEQLRHPPKDTTKLEQWIHEMAAGLILYLPPEEAILMLGQALWRQPEHHEEIQRAIRSAIRSPDPPMDAGGSAKNAASVESNGNYQPKSIPESILQRLKSCPQSGSGERRVHHWFLAMANALRHYVTAVEAAQLIADNASRAPKPGEIEDAIKKAYGEIIHSGDFTVIEKPTWPEPDLQLTDHCVINGIGLVDLWDESHLRWNSDEFQAEEGIDIVFPANLLLSCGITQEDFATRCRENWRGHLHRYAFIVPSPMTAVRGKTTSGKLSEHTKEATGPRTYLVIEFDFEEFKKDGLTETIWAPWVRKWRAFGISTLDACAALLWHLAQYERLVMVVHSGGKSLHGWFLALGRPENELLDFMRVAVRYGADKALWNNPGQFVRLPGGRRENGAFQSIYYINPQNAVVNRTPP